MGKTIAQYMGQFLPPMNNVKFVAGQYVIHISRSLVDGAVTAKHNFNGAWVNIPDAFIIDVNQPHFEHGLHINQVTISDPANGNVFVEMVNNPSIVIH